MELRDNRRWLNIREINKILEEAIEFYLNDLDDNDFADIITSSPYGKINITLCEESCICGDIENIPCQWFSVYCYGYNCSNFHRKNI